MVQSRVISRRRDYPEEIGSLSREELQQLIDRAQVELVLNEAILADVETDEDVTDVIQRHRRVRRWLTRAQADLRTLPEAIDILNINQVIERGGEKVEWLIDGLQLPAEGSCLVAGPPGAGKSWLVLHAALCVATGQSFLGKYEVGYGPVVVVDAESSMSGLSQRLQWLCRALEVDPNIPIWFSVKPDVLLDDDQGIDRLIDAVRPHEPILMVFDALIRLHRGDENSARDMGLVTKRLNHLQRSLGCGVILVQHEPKQGSRRRRRHAVRGSSELTAWPDAVVALDRKGGLCMAHVQKSRHSQDGHEIRFQLSIDEEAGRADLSFVSESISGQPADVRAKEAVARLLQDGQVWTRNRFKEALKDEGFGRYSIERALDLLEKDGKVERWVGAHGAFHYRMKNAA